MFVVSIPKEDVAALDTTGAKVRINGEEVNLTRRGNKLLYADKVRIIFNSEEQNLEVRGMPGIHPCISFFAYDPDQ